MDSLKNLRINAGWTQSQLAEKISSTQVLISNFENGTMLPDLELCLIIEKQFGQHIAWKDNHTPQQKSEIIQALSELSEFYPIPVAMEFAARMYRRERFADKIINFYASASKDMDDLEPYITELI